MIETIASQIDDRGILNRLLGITVNIERHMKRYFDTHYNGTSSLVLGDTHPASATLRAPDPTADSVTVFMASENNNSIPANSVFISEDGVQLGQITINKPWLNIGPARGLITAEVGNPDSVVKVYHTTYGHNAPGAPETNTENAALVKLLDSARAIQAALIDGYTDIIAAQTVVPASLSSLGAPVNIRQPNPDAVFTEVGFYSTNGDGPPNPVMTYIYEDLVLVGILSLARRSIQLLSSGKGNLIARNIGVAQTIQVTTRIYVESESAS